MSGTVGWEAATWGVLEASEGPGPPAAPEPVGLESPPPELDAVAAPPTSLALLLERCRAAQAAGVSRASAGLGLVTLLRQGAAADVQRSGWSGDPFRPRQRAAMARLTRRLLKGRRSAAEERTPRVAAAIRQALAAWRASPEHPARVTARLIEAGHPEELVVTCLLASVEEAGAPGPWYPLLREALAGDLQVVLGALSPLTAELIQRVEAETRRAVTLASRPQALALVAEALGPLADPQLLASLHLVLLEREQAAGPRLVEDEAGVPRGVLEPLSAREPEHEEPEHEEPEDEEPGLAALDPGIELVPVLDLPPPEPDPTAPRTRRRRGRAVRRRGRSRGGSPGTGAAVAVLVGAGLLVGLLLLVLLVGG